MGADRAAGHVQRSAHWRREIWAGVRRGLEILYGLYFIPVFLLWIVPTWIIVHFISDYRKAGRFTSAALKVLFALIGCRVRVVGKEYVDTPGAKVYAANHTSYFDVLALMLGLGVPYRFVAKMEVGGMPFIGTFLTQMRHTKFDRSDPQSRLRQSEELEKLLREGESVFVCLFSGRHIHQRGWRAAVSAWRVQSRGGCGRADRSGLRSRGRAVSARWNLFAAADQRHCPVSPPISPRHKRCRDGRREVSVA